MLANLVYLYIFFVIIWLFQFFVPFSFGMSISIVHASPVHQMYPRVFEPSSELAWILSWEARQPLLQCAYGSFGHLFARHGKLYVNTTKTQIWTLPCFATLNSRPTGYAL